MATAFVQQPTHPSVEVRIIKLKAAHVPGICVFNDQKASIRALTLRGLYFYERADFSLWVFSYLSIYPHPIGRPVPKTFVGHQRMVSKQHWCGFARAVFGRRQQRRGVDLLALCSLLRSISITVVSVQLSETRHWE